MLPPGRGATMKGMTHPTVLVVLFDGVQSLDVTGPLEVFTGAARVCGGPGAYRVRTASLDGAPVTTSSGLRIVPDEAFADEAGTGGTVTDGAVTGGAGTGGAGTGGAAPDTLLVPGGPGTRTPDPRLVDRLRRTGPRARRVVSVCTGAFLLAEAGLLDGRRATTHWSMCDTLARRFPEVDVDPAPIFVRDGDVATSAGVTAGIDLALALVEEDCGRDVALTVARHLVVFLRRPGNQTQFSAQLAAQTAERDPLREVQRRIAENPRADLSVETLARHAGLSPRHFARAFRDEVGVPPGRYVDQVRLEAARRMLEDTVRGVEEVARACGYGTPEAMRRAFVRALACSPAEYRRRFRPAAPTAVPAGAAAQVRAQAPAHAPDPVPAPVSGG